MAGNIRVVCRFRPQNSKEVARGGKVVANFLDSQTLHLHGNETDHKFSFDRIFVPSDSQETVYNITALPVVKDVFSGYNGTIFVYGQTSSGKTHTMMGPDGGKGMEDPALKGIIPRMVKTIFEQVENADEHVEFIVLVSYIEIYMEKICDLLDATKQNLPIREDKAKGIYVEGATEVNVASEEEVMNVMRTGQGNRSVGFTNMNAESSRSHSLFVVKVTQKDTRTNSIKSGKLYLVDLAGSEKVGKTGAKGTTLDEAKMINKSLSALGNVINALTDGKSKHIPYRDSKLTRVLQESIGGNSRTTLIINCSPDIYNELETLSTLRFGERAKTIKNKATVNEEKSVAEMKIMVTKLRAEVARLQKYTKTLEDELGIVKKGGTSSLALSLSESGSASAPASPTPHPAGSLQLLHDQIATLQKKISAQEEQINIVEESKNILIDQINEKQADLDEALEQAQALRELEATYKEETKQLKDGENSLIAAIAKKDIEIERLQATLAQKSEELENLEKTSKMNAIASVVDLAHSFPTRMKMPARKRSLSHNFASKQQIIHPTTTTTTTFQHHNSNIDDDKSVSTITSTPIDIKTDIIEENDGDTKFIENHDTHNIENEWKEENENVESETNLSFPTNEKLSTISYETEQKYKSTLKILESQIQQAVYQFDILRKCDTFMLKQQTLTLASQLEKLHAVQQETIIEKEKLKYEKQVSEAKQIAQEELIKKLEDQLEKEKALRLFQDAQYAKQFEEFARQTALQKQSKQFQQTEQVRTVKTLRGGGGKKKEEPHEDPKKTSGGFLNFFRSSPKPSPPQSKIPVVEMSPTDVFDFD